MRRMFGIAIRACLKVENWAEEQGSIDKLISLVWLYYLTFLRKETKINRVNPGQGIDEMGAREGKCVFLFLRSSLGECGEKLHVRTQETRRMRHEATIKKTRRQEQQKVEQDRK